MRIVVRSLLVLALVMAVGIGCRSRERRPNGFFTRPAQPAQPQLPLGGSQSQQPFVPPAPAPANPVPGTPAVPPPTTNVPPPPNFPTDTSRFGGGDNQQADFRWRPTQPTQPTQPRGGDSIRLLPPEPEGKQDRDPPKITERRQTPTPVPSKDDTNDVDELSLPVGIPQFSIIKPNVTGGLRPSLDEGLDWLKRKGYRTVLYLRAPGEAKDADQKQVEKRGMEFESIEVSPQTLSTQTLKEFTRIVTDRSNQPLFVYDRDGSLSGGLWYLYFRTVEHTSHDAASLRSGLRQETDDAHRSMWVAVQQYLKNNPE